MKKNKIILKFLLIISILYIPIGVNAKGNCTDTLRVGVCPSGCQFKKIEDAIEYVDSEVCDTQDAEVEIHIGEGTYNIESIDVGMFWDFKMIGSGIDKTIINYTGTYGFNFTYNYNLEVSDITIKGNNDHNSTYAIGLVYNVNEASIKNVKINAMSRYGIYTQANKLTKIDNVSINNAKDTAIIRDECVLLGPSERSQTLNTSFNPYSAYYNGVVEVNNSDLTKNGCGIVESTVYCDWPNPLSDEENAKLSGTININKYKYTSKVTNSKISCASSKRNPDSMYTPLIYIPKDNTWVQEPAYSENVVEYNSGQVQIELEENRTLALNNRTGVSITDIYENIDTFGEKEIDIEDESIVRIKGDKIIPIKRGETTVTIRTGNTTYTINLRVVESINNPKTSNTTYALLFLTGIIIISTITITFKSNKKRVVLK